MLMNVLQYNYSALAFGYLWVFAMTNYILLIKHLSCYFPTETIWSLTCLSPTVKAMLPAVSKGISIYLVSKWQKQTTYPLLLRLHDSC